MACITFFIFFCVYAYPCVHMMCAPTGGQVPMYHSIPEKVRGHLTFGLCLPACLRQESLLFTAACTRLTGLPDTGDSLASASHPPLGGYRGCASSPGFYIHPRDPNTGDQACVASTLSAEKLSPSIFQPWHICTELLNSGIDLYPVLYVTKGHKTR